MAVHERLAATFEEKREVRKPLLNRLHVRNIAALAVERRADVVEHVRGHVLDEQRVEVLQLVEGVELANLALLVGAHVHAKLVCVLEEDVVPQLADRLAQMVLLGEESHEIAGEVTCPVRVPHDDPRVRPADNSPRDALVATLRLKAVLISFALLEDRGVIRVVDVTLEGVAHEIVVRRADIRVADDVAHLEQRRVVVARRVIGVDDDFHTEKVLQVEEFFLLEPDDHRDVIYACLFELANLAFDENLSANLEHAFRALVRKRRHTRRKPRRHDNGVAHLVGGKLVLAFCRKRPTLDKAAIAKRFNNRVHRAERHAALRGNRALRGRRRLLQSEHHIEFRAGKHRGCPSRLYAKKRKAAQSPAPQS